MTDDATRQVFENLFRSGEGDLHDSMGATFSMDSLETYRAQATKWLGDRSELSSHAIESADLHEEWIGIRFQQPSDGISEKVRRVGFRCEHVVPPTACLSAAERAQARRVGPASWAAQRLA